MDDIMIIGAGGLGKETAWLINRINDVETKFNILGYIDDNLLEGSFVNGLKVLGGLEKIKSYGSISLTIAIANPSIRKNMYDKIKQYGMVVNYPNLVDPSVIISDDCNIGVGNIISFASVLTTNIIIGNFDIINYNCTVGHDVIIRDFCTLYPSVNVSGNVLINECVEIGTGTQIIQGLCIGNNSIVGAGAVVVNDLIHNCTAVGVPAKVIKKREGN